jgi:hypothetical protein
MSNTKSLANTALQMIGNEFLDDAEAQPGRDLSQGPIVYTDADLQPWRIAAYPGAEYYCVAYGELIAVDDRDINLASYCPVDRVWHDM